MVTIQKIFLRAAYPARAFLGSAYGGIPAPTGLLALCNFSSLVQHRAFCFSIIPRSWCGPASPISLAKKTGEPPGESTQKDPVNILG